MRFDIAAATDELTRTGRVLVNKGLVQASGGNLSALLADDTMLITGSGTWLDRLTPASFSTMSLDGHLLAGPQPSSEWLLHARIYLARPDLGSVLHLHPQLSLLLAALGKRIRFITQDHAVYVGSYGQTPYHGNGTEELADTAAAELADGTNNVVLMSNHGIAAVGDTIEMALRRAVNFEEAALLTFRALQLGDADTVFPADRAHLLFHV